MRAQRFGLNAEQVVGPTAQSNAAFSTMDLSVTGQNKADKISCHISKIKMRQEKFAEEAPIEANDKIAELEQRITKLHNVSKPEEIKSEAIIKLDCLYLYGTDYMSTEEIALYLI
jgi:hypothetical protein